MAEHTKLANKVLCSEIVVCPEVEILAVERKMFERVEFESDMEKLSAF